MLDGPESVPNLDFYALRPDAEEVLGFIFEQPGWVLHELYSVPNTDVRSFTSFHEVLDAAGQWSKPLHFQLHTPGMGGRPHYRRIELKVRAIPGATFRYSTDGWGLIQLYFEVPNAARLAASHTNHNSEVRAQKWEPTYLDQSDRVADWNWSEVSRASGRLNRFVRARSAAKHGSRPILPCANEAMKAGQLTLV